MTRPVRICIDCQWHSANVADAKAIWDACEEGSLAGRDACGVYEQAVEDRLLHVFNGPHNVVEVAPVEGDPDPYGEDQNRNWAGFWERMGI